jgi:hypothetical protein
VYGDGYCLGYRDTRGSSSQTIRLEISRCRPLPLDLLEDEREEDWLVSFRELFDSPRVLGAS